MFEVKVEGVDALLKKFDTFGKQIDELHTGDAAGAGERGSAMTCTANIRTSRSIAASRRDRSQHAKSGRARALPIQGRDAATTRRPKQHRVARAGRSSIAARCRDPRARSCAHELLQKLHDRMLKLTAEAMKWP